MTELACCIPVSLCRDLTSRLEEDIVDHFKTADPTTTLLIFAIQGLSACCCSFKDPLSTLSTVLLFAQGFTCTTLFKTPLSTIFKTALSTLSIPSRPHSERCRCFVAWNGALRLFAQNLSHARMHACSPMLRGVVGALRLCTHILSHACLFPPLPHLLACDAMRSKTPSSRVMR